MQFQTWEYTKPIDLGAPREEVPTGLRTVKISDCSYDPETTAYKLKVEDLETGVRFQLSYWLTKAVEKVVDGVKVRTDEVEPNKTSNGTLASLFRALYGDEYDPARDGILAPGDVIGRVVVADVKLGKPSPSGIQYPRVYEYQMAHENDSWASEAPQKFRKSSLSA